MASLLGCWTHTSKVLTPNRTSQRPVVPGVPSFQGGTEDPCCVRPRVTTSSSVPLFLSHCTPNLSSALVSSVLTTHRLSLFHHLDLKHPSPSRNPMSPGPLVPQLMSPSSYLFFNPVTIVFKSDHFNLCLKPATGGKTLKPPPSGFPSENWISQMTFKDLKGLYKFLSLPCNQPLTVPFTLALQPRCPLCHHA